MPETAAVPRPKLDKTKQSVLHVRVYPELRAAIESIAVADGRSMSQMCDRLLREAVLARLKAAEDEEAAAVIDDLPW